MFHTGYGGSLFGASTPYDAEDKEADEIYASVDARMAQRNEARKRKQAAKVEKTNGKRPKLQEQFADVKRQLATLTDSEWMSIPEPGDLSRRNKRINTRSERFTPVWLAS
jgi:pre-mRNA-processing factor 6